MPFVNDETAAAYRKAWEEWLKQIEHVHRVLLEEEPIRPDQLKGLLNREARRKAIYDEARDKLLGLDASPLASPADGDNPFKSE